MPNLVSSRYLPPWSRLQVNIGYRSAYVPSSVEGYALSRKGHDVLWDCRMYIYGNLHDP